MCHHRTKIQVNFQLNQQALRPSGQPGRCAGTPGCSAWFFLILEKTFVPRVRFIPPNLPLSSLTCLSRPAPRPYYLLFASALCVGSLVPCMACKCSDRQSRVRLHHVWYGKLVDVWANGTRLSVLGTFSFHQQPEPAGQTKAPRLSATAAGFVRLPSSLALGLQVKIKNLNWTHK